MEKGVEHVPTPVMDSGLIPPVSLAATTMPKASYEYRLKKIPPREGKTEWTMAPEDVEDTGEVDLSVVAKHQQTQLSHAEATSHNLAPPRTHLTFPSTEAAAPRGQKRPAPERCSVKPKWPLEKLTKSYSQQLDYKALQDECRAHTVSQNGDKATMVAALRQHLKGSSHQDVARKSQTKGIASYFSSKAGEE